MGLDYKHHISFYLFSLLLILHTLLVSSQATNNSIAQGQLIRDGQTIISSGRVFELGFFSPQNSTSRFVGIWYYRIPVQTVVWVANRQNPISGNLGVLSMGNNGNLMVMDGNGGVVWSTGLLRSSSTSTSSTSTAVLLDNGNLILSSGDIVGNDTNPLWQSYDHPSDTYLFGMKIHVMDSLRGENHSFVSWKSDKDPSNGNCTMGIDPQASPQIVTWNGTQRLWRSGHWNGEVFLGIPSSRAVFPFNYRLHTGPEGPYFTFAGINTSTLMNFRMRWDGIVEQVTWDEGAARWMQRLKEPSNDCGNYNRCGNFGICSMTDSRRCSCMEGFVPRYLHQWNGGNWSGGCIRRTPLQCVTNGNVGDGFLQMTKTKFPDDADISMANPRDCKEGCLRNCSCNAYAFLDGIGCMTWSGDLVDVEQLQVGGGTLYIRLSNSELGKGDKSNKSTIAAIIIAVLGTTCIVAVIWFLWRFRGKLRELSTSLWNDKKPLIAVAGGSQEFSIDYAAQDEFSTELQNGVPLPHFSFNSVEVSTDTFSNKNKLGEGGFGPVYKGTLPGGQLIAVKRLSKWSGQGIEEFKNELILIAKLQHRNLVRLLGYCIEGEEKLLIYEYMPNKSLDTFLFDPVKKAELEWRTRSMIIEGIARGLLYLHRDSRLRIIHRDLKVSNILLDEEMNPKISDFGMARIFGGNQIEANTIRVVGTYGYMSPEYAMEGLFSVKSDVYSFGVLLLEIVSGQKSNSFRSDECLNLIQHAWNLWKEGKTAELIDPCIEKSCNTKEALQCVHVAMLCVQMSPVNRPTMASVVLMLESENASLPQPIQTDYKSMSYGELYSVVQDHDISESTNDVTITQVTGR